MAKKQKKRCSCCGEVKPVSDFFKAKARKDGLTGQCKLCMKIAGATGATLKAQTQANEPAGLQANEPAGLIAPDGVDLSIGTWSQADSVLREICEVELALKAAVVNRNRRILKIKNDSDIAVNVFKKQRQGLFAAIERFALGEQQFVGMKLKVLRFGTIRAWDGECDIELSLAQVIKSRGKP